MESERLDTLKDNEEHIAKGGVETDSDAEDENDEEQDMADDVAVSDDSDADWKETQRIFTKLGPKLQSGKALTQAEMEEFGLDEDGQEDDLDSDFELNGGDDALYDSAWDEVDELKYLRDTLTRIQTQD
jgi:hypothetical protein